LHDYSFISLISGHVQIICLNTRLVYGQNVKHLPMASLKGHFFRRAFPAYAAGRCFAIKAGRK
jgi:hypothetical protein